MKKGLFIICLACMLCSCEQEEGPYAVEIDPEVQPYIELFVAEAEARGQDVDFTEQGLIVSLEAIGGNVPGQCESNPNAPNELRIDSAFWKAYTAEQRELLIFHELGHCYLDLGHEDAQDESGHCLSIMRSSTLTCIIDFTGAERTALLDELFVK